MRQFVIETTRKIQAVDISEQVRQNVLGSSQGLCMVYCPHSTAALVIAEPEDDLMGDYERVIELLFAHTGPFRHCGHGNPNAEAHIFSALHGCSVFVPLKDGQLQMGKFQSVLLFECDGPRKRTICVYTYSM